MNDYDDIEILDIFDNKKEEPLKGQEKPDEPKVEEIGKHEAKGVEEMPKKKEKTKKLKVRKPKKNTTIIQIIFCSLSALFILGCCVFYGSRLIKYYKIYNPSSVGGQKTLLLSNKISSETEIVYEGSGVYLQGGNYIYKGNVTNNYLLYNNLLWRIIKINSNGTIQVILEDYINLLNYDTESVKFVDSSLNKYLNDVLLSSLNKDLLVKTSYCTDPIDSLTDITCDNTDDNYVTLLDVTNFLNSVSDNKSYLNHGGEIFWLNNYNQSKIWHTNGVNVSQSLATNFYEIRPVVTLKATIPYISGDGTKDNPYLTSKEHDLMVGSIVKLGEDKWVVYEKGDVIKLTSLTSLKDQYRFDKQKVTFDPESVGSLAQYLNTTYLEKLSYRNLLQDATWYNGEFKENYQDVKNSKVKAKVGLLNLMDLKLDSSITNYYLTTSFDNTYVYAYGDNLKSSKPTMYRNIRPCIALSNNIKLTGDGTNTSPFEVEE